MTVEDACKSQGKRGTDLMNKCRMRFNFLSVGFLLSALCGNSIYKSSVHVAVCFQKAGVLDTNTGRQHTVLERI